MKKTCLFLTLLSALLTSVAAEAQNYLMSTVKPGTTYIRVAPEWQAVMFTAAATTISVPIECNTDYTVTGRTAWISIKQEPGQLVLTVKASTATAVRTATLTLKGNDGAVATIGVTQLGKNAAALVSKSKLAIYPDRMADTLKVIANADYTVSTPDWLRAEQLDSVTYAFTADPIYDMEKREGDIVITNAATNAQLAAVTMTQYYKESWWHEKPLFAVVSDIHFGDTDAQTSVKRWPRWFKTINNYSPGLDAIVIIGDLADHGLEAEYDSVATIFKNYMNPSIRRVFIRGNHDNIKSASGNYFTKYIGQPFNQYIEIKGYPFITLSCSSTAFNYDPTALYHNTEGKYATTKCYNDATIAFLEASLADATVKYPGKPVFVFSHILVTNTIKSTYTAESYRADDIQLRPVLDKYPQAIHFSGHTHQSVGIEENAAQPSFAAFNDGAHKNNGYNGPGFYQKGAANEFDYGATTEGLVVRIDKNDDVILERWNTSRGVKYPTDWRVCAPFDGVDRTLANRNGGKTPWWNSGDAISITDINGGSCTIAFPQAQDDEEVYKYHINITNSAGTKVISEIKQSSLCHWGDKRPAVMEIPVSGLPQATSLTVKVVPYDFFKQAGTTLSKTFTLP